MLWDSMFFWPFMAGFMAIQVIIGLIVLVFVVLMIIDCVKRKFNNDAEKIIWIVLIIVTTWLGALLYYIFVRALNPKGIAKK